MKSFKEKEKKYKYKFFKAVLDKDNNNIHTYVQKYLEYCTDSDIKNIFNKKNDLYGGSFNDDEKKYEDKQEEYKASNNVYEKTESNIINMQYFQGEKYTNARLLALKNEEFIINVLKYFSKLGRLEDVHKKLDTIFISKDTSKSKVVEILKKEVDTIKTELDELIRLNDKEKTELETICNTIDNVKKAEDEVAGDSSNDDLIKILADANATLNKEFEKVKATPTATATKLPMNYALLDSQYYNNSKFFYNTSDVPEKNKLNIKIYDK